MFTNFQRLFIPWFWSFLEWAVWVARSMVPGESRTFWQFWFYIPRSSKVQSFVLEFMLGMWLQKPFVLETGVGVLGAYIQSWSVLGQPFQLAQGSIRESFLEFLADSSPNWSHNIDEAWTYMNYEYHLSFMPVHPIISYKPLSQAPWWSITGAGPPHPSQRPCDPATGAHHAPGAAAVGGARQRWEHGAPGSTGPNCTKGTAGDEADRSQRG